MRYVRDLIINSLCNHTLLYAKYIIFIDDIGYFDYALRSIDLILVSHVKCHDNKPAYLLAKFDKEIDNIDNYVTWIKENSSLIKSAITHDVLNLSSSK